MNLLKRVQIENLRSCRRTVLADCGEFNVVVGPNNSGKSNILRALSLFFNDEVEPGAPLDLTRDFGGRQKTKRQVSITVELEFPDYFGRNKRYQQLMASVGRTCSIRRTWSLGEPSGQPELVRSGSGHLGDPEAAADILSLVQFRFVPAHRDPARLLREEEPGIIWELARRFKTSQSRRASGTRALDELLPAVGESAGAYLAGVSDELSRQVRGVESVSAVTADDIAALIRILGYRFELSGGLTLDSALQGSGVQTSLLFQMLALSDTAFSKYFGTKQGVVWVVEEPECFLHTALECEVGDFFARSAEEPRRRFQIFASTHSDIMMQYAHQGYLVTLEEGFSVARPRRGRELVERAASSGIARLEHALLWRRTQPVVLVEGKSDRQYLEKAAEVLGRRVPYTLADLEMLPGGNGGHDTVVKFLRKHGRVLGSRPESAPVIYVADWDAKFKPDVLTRHLRQYHATSRAICTDEAGANPDLHVSRTSFKGSELFLPTRLIEYGAEQGWFGLSRVQQTGKLQPAAPLSASAKRRLAERFLCAATREDARYLENVLKQVDRAVAGAEPRFGAGM